MEVDEQPEAPKEEKNTEVKPEQKDTKTTIEKEKKAKQTNKIDISTKFKAPGEKSPKKQKIEPQQKTPVKIDVLEEVAMPSWSDNSSNEIIRPKETEKDTEVTVVEDSEDIKLVYDETRDKSTSQSPNSPKAKNTKEQSVPKPVEAKRGVNVLTPKRIPNSERAQQSISKVCQASLDTSSFLSRARLTDARQPADRAPARSAAAPRRVAFVTLSSPKHAKKK